jgi:hypothetical protein
MSDLKAPTPKIVEFGTKNSDRDLPTRPAHFLFGGDTVLLALQRSVQSVPS